MSSAPPASAATPTPSPIPTRTAAPIPSLATVYASPNAGDDFSLCASASPEALGGSPAGGTWTGTGVQSDGDDGYEFNPSGLGGDSYTLTYTDENGCSDTLTATVYASPNAGDDFSLCASASPEALGGSPAGGTWTGTGVQSDGDDGYEFNPSGLGGDSYTLTYTDENGCSDTLLATVYASPNAGDDFSLCASASPEALGGSPAGGTWTGTGVQSDGDDGYEFNPSGLGGDSYTLTYTDENGCSDTLLATVYASPNAGDDFSLCASASPEALGGSPAGGTWTGTGVQSDGDDGYEFNPSGLGGDSYTLTYTDENGCSDTLLATVYASPNAGDDFSLCASASPEALGGSPAGGTWTGTGVQSDGDDGYEFNPSGLGGDSYTLTYTDENGCSDTLLATVYASPNAGDDFSLCASASPEALGGSPAGGTWTGTGVQSDGDDGYEFNPSGLGGDSYTLTYTDENGCSDTLLATVYASPNAGDDFSLCASASPEALGGSPAGGTWTGTGVQSDGDDGYEFSPSGLGGDSYTLTYTDENGCSDTLLATVYASPNAGDDFSLCASASPEALGGSPAGGTWTGTGVQSDGDDGYEFNPSGLGGDSYTLTYTDENGCSDTLLATVYASPNAGDDFSLCASASPEALGGSPAGGTWTGTGVQSDGDDGYEFRPLRPRRRLLHPHLYRRERLLRYPPRHRLRQPQRGR